MSHLVSASAHRLGKTFLWKNNFIAPAQNKSFIQPVNSALVTGVEFYMREALKRRRMYLVKGNLKFRFRAAGSNFNVLFMPRIKSRPKTESRGSFIKHAVLRHRVLGFTRVLSAHNYVDGRRLKNFEFPFIKSAKINKWLFKRMFRGSLKSLHAIRWISKRRIKPVKMKIWKGFKARKKRAKALLNYKLLNWKLSVSLSNSFGFLMKIKCFNIFKYFIAKKILTMKNYQEHLWHRRLRNQRFYYQNYYDIVNSFFILSVVRGTENVLLDIIKVMLPRILKHRRFMYFLGNVVKFLPQIRANFSCFKFTITGKLAGGTKRTKSLTVGFGVLPIQSLNQYSSTNFVGFWHVYGAFGVKLIMSRIIR